MAAKHLNREELKKDEVAETIQTLVDDFNENRTAILATIGVIVLAIGIYVTVTRRAESHAIENTEILSAAHEKIASARLADPEARNEELLTAITSLQTLADKRGSSPAGLSALYAQGNCYYLMDDFAQAASTFEKFLQKAGNDIDRARGHLALGQTHESDSFMAEAPEKMDAALSAYEKAASLAPKDSYLHALALMNQARVHELREDDEKALAFYKQVIELRDAPREDIPGFDEDTDQITIETGNPFIDSLFEDVLSGTSQLSFKAEAQARIDRIEAGRTVDASEPEAS